MIEKLPGCFGTYDEFEDECYECSVNQECSNFLSYKNDDKYKYLKESGDQFITKCPYDVFIDFCSKLYKKKVIKKIKSGKKRRYNAIAKRTVDIIKEFFSDVNSQLKEKIYDTNRILYDKQLYFIHDKKKRKFLVNCKNVFKKDTPILKLKYRIMTNTFDVSIFCGLDLLYDKIAKKDLKVLKFVGTDNKKYSSTSKNLNVRKLAIFKKVFIKILKLYCFEK